MLRASTGARMRAGASSVEWIQRAGGGGLHWLCRPHPRLGGLAPLAAAWFDPAGATKAASLLRTGTAPPHAAPRQFRSRPDTCNPLRKSQLGLEWRVAKESFHAFGKGSGSPGHKHPDRATGTLETSAMPASP